MNSMSRLFQVKGMWLVARREINTRVRSKSFVISTVLVLVALAALALAEHLTSGSTAKVGFVGQATGLAPQLQTAASAQGTNVQVSTVTDIADGERQVADGKLDALAFGAPSTLHVTVKDGLPPTLHGVLDELVRQQVLDGQLAGAGLSPALIRSTMDKAHVEVHTLSAADPYRTARLSIGFAVMILLFMSIQLFGQAVAQGVVEEKSSRVVEILLSTLRPWQLMTGKVLGVGIAGLLQILIIVVVTAVGVTSSGLIALPPGSAGIIGWSVLWYLLGFFLFSALLATAASLVSRQEELASVITPVTILLIAPYVIGISQITSNPNSKLVEVLSLIPPFSPILMPARIALDGASAWQIGLALVLTVIALAGILLLGSRIYANAVLRTGARVKLREALSPG